MPSDETGGGGFDLKGALAQYRSSSPSGASASSAPTVPLWKKMPSQPAIVRRGGRDAADIVGIQATRVMAGPAYGAAQLFSSDEAEAHWLDMEEEDRVAFLKLAQRAGLVGQKNITPADLAGAWAKAVKAAQSYNAQQKNRDKYVSPWEAVEKLAAQSAAGLGGYYDSGAGGSQAGTTRNTRVNNKKFTENDIRSTAESIAKDMLGRAPNSSELASYVAAVQRAYDANPERQTVTTTTDELGNSSSVSEQSGGVDPTPIMADITRKTPEHAYVQAATQYFPALMQALSAPV